MTAFILVSGMFTGTHIWQDTVARLTAAGAEVHTVALTGLDGPRAAGDGAVDLETHIADVLAVVDSVLDPAGGAEDGDRRIVLVGHDYGIHPAVGAADRRAERIERIVYLDSGLPRDGVPALAAVPDQSLRDSVAGTAGSSGADEDRGVLPPPALGEWSRWGSTAGVPDAALDRLTALAAPQPLGTLLQPLRLTGAVGPVPTTGVLCTGNGSSIELVQMLVRLGDPALRPLTDPRVTFFELPTGHWPMLSCPAELTDVLLRAAAGEGHRLEPVDDAAGPGHLQPFLMDVPDVPRERHGNVDLYLPDAEEPRPAVVFVHGGPVPADARPTPRDWPGLTGYARCVAGDGAVGVLLDHRLHDLGDYERAAADVAAAVELARADPRVDQDRIALWFFSGGGLISADWLDAPPAWLRCLAATYPVLAPLPNWGLSETRLRPARAVANAGDLPVVLTRVGLEMPELAATVEQFLAAARDGGADVEVIDVPNGHHGFETIDVTDESRAAVRHAIRTVLGHAFGPGTGPGTGAGTP
ncbi:alpha/beta hydrolase [Streptomyces sp. RK23]|uniref:alpha/beta hydrolase n=1 Tax=unclassified Streptomyces TaxID=2593676 RepID=UPI001B35C540|nr:MULTISPECIES: alpha/beta fold hydrolase [unclassified Streptomyces]MBQ0964268.1 alpha/beta hydrolase [Streptomyces sp. RK74B]MBQ1003480.1 alpha/beta hydrolase [Streptomyces sp. RK23]